MERNCFQVSKFLNKLKINKRNSFNLKIKNKIVLLAKYSKKHN